MSIKVIAITGGPCAGKTSAMDVLRERFDCAGINAAFIPEAATDLIKAGVAPWTCTSMLEFQTHVVALQLEREAAAFGQAAANETEVIICDRGICDSHAYLSDAEYASALAANGIDHAQALSRYDAVFHLETVAKHHPEKYTKANNTARFENAEEAACVDDRVIAAWSDHPAFHVIESFISFDEKTEALLDAIMRFLETGPHGNTIEPGNPVLVSACLLGKPCRYDGKSQPCETVISMTAQYELVPVCPEQLGGLPTPRTPSEIQMDGHVVDAEGENRTAAFESGASETLRIAREHDCKQAILKENSPSCGVHRIYDGTFSSTLVPGMGKTAALLAASGIEVLSELDIYD